MAGASRLICASADLVEGGRGVRFTLRRGGEEVPAFALRYDGVVRAYVNRCQHVPVELDWEEGAFFDYAGLHIVCSTHGAAYLPDTGQCVAGPCKGRRLTGVPVQESDGRVWLLE